MKNLSNHNHSQQTIEQNVVFLRTLEFRLVSPRRRNRLAMRWIKEAEGRTFCFDVIISATIFARRKSAGGNMIGLN